VLSVDRQEGPDGVTVLVQGVVDLVTAPQLEQAIDVALTRGDRATPLVVDLAGLQFMDSAGISALLKGRRHAVDAGRDLRVVGATGLVLEVLQLTGVWPLLSRDTS
jgi:anti-sigma B factor antagonist